MTGRTAVWAPLSPRSCFPAELASIGIGQLIGRIDRKWDTRDAIRARLAECVPALRERARRTNQSRLRLLAAAP
jgi:hypothetical protein